MWRFTGYYGYLERSRKKESWQLVKHLATLSSLPWVIMGETSMTSLVLRRNEEVVHTPIG